ncbi:MAG: cysteine--tRNA ligase [Proteobacteria bacterium]|nr:cysteine--tRNA ligase [Pseudomonadota bacterium]
MQITLFNSLTQKKEDFKPLNEKRVGMYVCGPTVYDRPHVGNARAVVVYDVLFRVLRHVYGEKNVTYVRNITDVDDKINAAAKANNEPISALTQRITESFHADMAALNNLPPTEEPRATAHIQEMVEIIQKLIANGYAYESAGHVLFAVGKDKHYGTLSGRKLEDLIAGARVEVESYKKEAGDFVLWKPADPGDDPSSIFDSPWGKGRPGWHIECSAMSSKYLGHDFDIHGGGADLKFPHHENEIAQSTCAHKGSHYAKYWVHNGFVTVNGEKMAKSAGNFTTVRQLLERGVKGEVIRYVLLATHYRKPLDFSDKGLEDAKKVLDKFYRATEGVKPGKLPEGFVEALADDMNTLEAIAILHRAKPEELKAAGQFMGFLNMESKGWFSSGAGDVDASAIESLIQKRAEAKKAKDFATADKIRAELTAQGIVIEDSASGTTWRKA